MRSTPGRRIRQFGTGFGRSGFLLFKIKLLLLLLMLLLLMLKQAKTVLDGID